MRRIFCFLGLLLPSNAWAECEHPITVDQLVTTIESGETAFVHIDKAALEASKVVATTQIDCLSEPIGQSEAARFHRLIALSAFVTKDHQRAMSEFAVAIGLEPYYVFPEGIVPSSDHPVSVLYGQAASYTLPQDTQTVLAPTGGWSTVDGVRTDVRRSGVSAIVQIMDARGTIADSRFVLPLQSLPTLDLSKFNIDLNVKPPSIFHSKPAPWLIASATGLVVSGALYGVAMYEKSRFEDTDNPVPDDELVALQSATNALGIAWVGATVLTAATGIVTFTVVIPNHHKRER